MSRILKIFLLITGCVFVNSCGGQDEATTVTATPPAEAKPSPKKASNPLARQQQLIRDAKGIQAILDKDAAEKKKALENIN